MSIKSISPQSKDYPDYLKEIFDPPGQLYINSDAADTGRLLKGNNLFAMVGTRIPSSYGKSIAYKISKEITECGGIVVSGLAFGIDAVCHLAAVHLNKPTIAVLASGIEKISPGSHLWLAKSIIKSGGLIVSEYRNSDPGFKYKYLKRNRIISGLCKATIVIEAKEKSGALITARHAFEQNRDIYALTGDINRPQARGCHKLIREDNAKPILDIGHLLDELGLKTKETAIQTLDLCAVSILNLLKKGPRSIYEIIDELQFSSSEINASISTLELKNLISQNLKWKWILNRDGRYTPHFG